MELLTSVFRQLLSMSLTALPVMAVVLSVRLLLGKAPKRFSYLLWAVVAFRLACPVSFTSPVGLVEPEAVERRVETAGQQYLEPTLTYIDNGYTPDYGVLLDRGYTPNPYGEIVTNEAGTREAWQAEDLLPIVAVVWLLGVAAVAAYGAGTCLRLRRRVATAVLQEGNVWECDGIPTPFVLGFFRPRIYIPFRLSEEERLYVLAHERYHIKHLDHWVKLLGYLILAAYWWDPAVWLCWVLCCRDMEMRCDEAVLAQLGDQVKTGYSLSLVSFALDRRAPMALAFGEHDAARRVKNVLVWKQARPAVVFLAVAAVLLVAAVCGTDAERGSWLKAEQNGNEVSFTCELKEPIRSWAIWEDIYEEGRLVSSRACVMDSFQEDGGASARQFTGMLSVRPENKLDDEFQHAKDIPDLTEMAYHIEALNVSVRSMGGFKWELTTLPKDHYTGMGSVLGDGIKTPDRWQLEDDGSVVLYTVLLSTEPEGGIRVGRTTDDVFANDTVVQFRFVTSTGPVENLMDESLAQTLFSLRTDSVRDTEGITAILNILGVSQWGSFQVSGGRDMGEMRIRVAFDAELAGSPGFAQYMEGVGYLLQALVGDAEVAEYTTGEVTASLFSGGPVYSWAREQGYDGLKDMAKTVEGLQTLLDYLGWEGQPAVLSDPLDQMARALYALRTDGSGERPDVEALLEVLRTDALGTYTVTWRDDGTAQVDFDSLAVGGGTLRLGMQKRAAAMMAVCPELRVSWTYEDPDSGLEVAESAGVLTRDDWTISLGIATISEEAVVAGIRDLLVRLGMYDLFALLEMQAPAGAFWQLLNDGIWGDAPGDLSLSGTDWNNGVLTFRFLNTPKDPGSFDVYLARCALVLMYVKQEVQAVAWSYPGADGAVVGRMAAAAEASIITGLFADFEAATTCPVTSQAELDRLLRFADLDSRVYQLWLERSAGPETSVSHTARQMFELAQEDTPDALAEDLLCWDIWGDPAAAGAYTQTVENGRLELVFQDSSLWEEKVLSDYRMARNGCLLLALRPELDMVLARGADRTSYMRMTRETAARILPEGKTIGDYGASPEMLMELIALLEDDTVFAGRTEQLEF